jgi:hypothetical protein
VEASRSTPGRRVKIARDFAGESAKEKLEPDDAAPRPSAGADRSGSD